MEIEIFQIDAFTSELFKGNPACVMPLDDWLPDELLLNIAKENNVSETAFFVKKNNGYHLRWFTPEIEMDLCGHATLATAHVIKSELNYSSDVIYFKTLSGNLSVCFDFDFYYLNFPSRKADKTILPNEIKSALNIQPKEVFKSRDYMLVYDNEQDIKNIRIDRFIFDKINLNKGGVIVTAKGTTTDFVSRFFTPQATILEDPVTGSAHCTLIPYWSELLSKKQLLALQISDRGGVLYCENNDDRVLIGGQAVVFSKGFFTI